MGLVLPLIKETLPLQRPKADYAEKLHEEKKKIFHNYAEELHFVKNKLLKNIMNKKNFNDAKKGNSKKENYSNNILRAELHTSDAELPNEIILNANKKDSDSVFYSLEPVYKQIFKKKKSFELSFEDFWNEKSDSLETPLGETSITHPSSNAHTLFIDFKRPFFYSSSNWIQKNSCHKQLNFFRVLNHSHNFTAENMKSKIAEWPSENIRVYQLFSEKNLSHTEPFTYYIKSKQSLPRIQFYLKSKIWCFK